MAWLGSRRGAEPPTPPPPEDDSPQALNLKVQQLVWYVNKHSGELPTAAVVGARQILDDLREALEPAVAAGARLDVYLLITVKATLTDYLPTTLRTYLAIDPAQRDVPHPPAGTPTDEFLKQIADLELAAESLLAASRKADPDALLVQGRFLQTKFAGSDLDLP